MRGAVLAAAVVVAAVAILGAATATWVEVTTPGAVVEGVRLPDDVTGVTGAGSPAGVSAAGAALLAALPLALIGVADRLGRRVGTAARAVATGLGVLTVALAATALATPTEVVVLGDADVVTTPVQALFGGAALAVLVLAALSWRVPRSPVAEEASRYTVEAVRAEAEGTAPVRRDGPDDEVDEWDLATAPAPPPGAQPATDPHPRPDPDPEDRR